MHFKDTVKTQECYGKDQTFMGTHKDRERHRILLKVAKELQIGLDSLLLQLLSTVNLKLSMVGGTFE